MACCNEFKRAGFFHIQFELRLTIHRPDDVEEADEVLKRAAKLGLRLVGVLQVRDKSKRGQLDRWGRLVLDVATSLPEGTELDVLVVDPSEQDQFVAAIRQGLEDSEAGRVVDDEALGRDLDAEFGQLEPG